MHHSSSHVERLALLFIKPMYLFIYLCTQVVLQPTVTLFLTTGQQRVSIQYSGDFMAGIKPPTPWVPQLYQTFKMHE